MSVSYRVGDIVKIRDWDDDIGWFYAVEFDRPIDGRTLLYFYGGKSYRCGSGCGACYTDDCLEPAEILPGNIKLSFDYIF